MVTELIISAESFLGQVAMLFDFPHCPIAFLTAIAAFEGLLVALLIPLSIDIVTKVSERYSSDNVSKLFWRSRLTMLVWKFLLINVVLVILAIFFLPPDGEPMPYWFSLITWVLLLFFLIIAVLVVLFIFHIKKYMGDSRFFIEEFDKEIEKAFNSKGGKNWHIIAIEGIGDILVFETKRRKAEFVIEALPRFFEYIEKLFELNNKSPKKFENLVYSAEYFKFSEDEKKNTDSCMGLGFKPKEKYSPGYFIPLDQLVRIYETAVCIQDRRIVIDTIIEVDAIVRFLSREEVAKERFLRCTLERILEITRIACAYENSSNYGSLSSWYMLSIFMPRGENEPEFDYSKLDLFNYYLTEVAKILIEQNAGELFKSFVQSLVDDFHFYDCDAKIWNYCEVLPGKELHAFVDRLHKTEDLIDSKNAWDEWWKKFEELKEKVSDSDRKKADILELEIRKELISKYKYNSFLKTVFIIGAYCLRGERYEFINSIWHVHQPADSDYNYADSDIIPKDYTKIITRFLRSGVIDMRGSGMTERKGIKKYCEEYFLLLLAYFIKGILLNAEKGQHSSVASYSLPVDLYENNELDKIKGYTDLLIKEIPNLKKEISLFEALGFDISKLDELFDENIKPLLESIKEQADTTIKTRKEKDLITLPLSPDRIEKYKQAVKSGFYKQKKAIRLFSYFKAYIEYVDRKEDSTIEIDPDKKLIFNRLCPRDMFFKENNWGGIKQSAESEGSAIARDGDDIIFKAICEKCQDIEKDEFPAILDEFEGSKDDIVILLAGTGIILYNFMEVFNNFTFNEEDSDEEKLIVGWYQYKEHRIPVIKAPKKDDKFVLILNKNKAGKLEQLSPLNPGEEKKYLDDIFCMKITDLLTDENHMEAMLNEPQNKEWLNKNTSSTTEEDHKKYLQKHVEIQVFERFRYEAAEDFEGYKFKLVESPRKSKE